MSTCFTTKIKKTLKYFSVLVQNEFGGVFMKLTIMGYIGGYPSQDGASPIYVVESKGYTLMLDMGSGGLMTYQKYKQVSDIDAVLLSHYHADHIADVGVLQHALLVQSYLTGTRRVVPIYGHTEDRDQFRKLNHTYTKAVAYVETETLKLGPFFIRFIKTKHSVPCYGMRITDGNSTVVYTADSAYQESFIPFSKNADVLLADCNFYQDQDGSKAGHMTSTEVGYIAKTAGVKQLILTHLPHFGDHHQLVNEAKSVFSGDILLAHEGLVWEK